ncbi:ATP-binding protein [Pelosinus sp. sgz500959]|uniref:ATP-binding protein n=1 Tax=Pelosinus sp. sgz500959 TaxID=3242472 RepID=UPI00366C827B
MFWDLNNRRSWSGYVVAVLVVAISVGLRIGFFSELGNRAPYLMLYPAVTIVAAYGGFFPGLLATCLSGLLSTLLWVEPLGSIRIDAFGDQLAVGIFFLSCCIISAVCEMMQRAQIKLRDSKVELATKSELLDAAADYIMVRDLDSRVIYWNRGAEKGYGFTADEAIGEITHELLKTQFPQSSEAIKAELLTRGQWEGELTHTCKNGVTIVVQSNQTLNRDTAGNPISMMEINHDITEKKKAEEAIIHMNALLQGFNNELEFKVAERTRELQDINAAMEEEIMERHGAEQSLRESEQRLQDINATLEEEIMERQAAEQSRRESEQGLQDINAALEEEIMERQAVEKTLIENEHQLRSYSEELMETNKELTSFANGIAHDFRSPMVNLKGFSHELKESLFVMRHILKTDSVHMPDELQEKVDQLLDRDVPDSLKFIYSSVDRLDRMVNALLGLARMGRQDLVLQDVDMGPLLNQAIQSLKHQIEANHIQVTIGPLPTVKANRVAMEQIIGNLLDNAVKYQMPNRLGKISITCSDENERHIFVIEDNGRGIDENDYEKIFQIFRRTGQQDVPGDGLGLAYVRTLIRQLGGRVWVESELGIGTKMKFSVPKFR